jgi:hypothetical protein
MTTTIEHWRVYNAGTAYELTVVDDDGEDWYLLFASNLESHNGDWLKIPVYLEGGPSIAWSYLTEKCPGLLRFGGDKPGWIKVCKEAGIKVFG